LGGSVTPLLVIVNGGCTQGKTKTWMEDGWATDVGLLVYIWRRGGAVGDMSHDAHLGRSTQEKIASKKAQKVIF
jgi:hypothetical protein